MGIIKPSKGKEKRILHGQVMSAPSYPPHSFYHVNNTKESYVGFVEMRGLAFRPSHVILQCMSYRAYQTILLPYAPSLEYFTDNAPSTFEYKSEELRIIMVESDIQASTTKHYYLRATENEIFDDGFILPVSLDDTLFEYWIYE